METPLSQIKPFYHPFPSSTELPAAQNTLDALNLQSHIEGGYFVETDRDPYRIPNPYLNSPTKKQPHHANGNGAHESATRSASTSIYYYLTPKSPMGAFHRNRSRTVHTLHRGRGRYVIIHADEVEQQPGRKARIETFVVGHNIAKGEKLQWIVEGGKFKASYLLPDEGGDAEGRSDGLLISETVVPGFEYADHDFMPRETLEELLTEDQIKELDWLLRRPEE